MISESSVESFIDDEWYEKIVSFYNEKNILLSPFKKAYIKRRLYLRAIALNYHNIEDYYRYLKKSAEEYKIFEKILTINVSYFFRNWDTFSTIKEKVLPDIFKKKEQKGEKYIKILSIGCASGEEPYSLAIILKEYFPEEIKTFKPYILGIDFDSDSITFGRIGIFDEQRLIFTPDFLLKKYFVKIDNKRYEIKEEIKKMVILTQEDVFRKDLKKYWDIVLCRNMLIYIDIKTQEALLKKVYSICLNGSYLILGKSESLWGGLRNLFFPVFPKERIYVKKECL
ncbi:MAG: protein-glutamate O-methyltransferase CheR [Proteobacteria bacterium]|nr:protein-glutamate O-methyltransferase CheR [Pseudomonadota bacterium]